ncbi:MAG: hypothetical protein CMO80_15140 [Verrucomicrobiales bacterium]|nr:hypothetical protein [Verrucomicrobiales bacterium]
MVQPMHYRPFTSLRLLLWPLVIAVILSDFTFGARSAEAPLNASYAITAHGQSQTYNISLTELWVQRRNGGIDEMISVNQPTAQALAQHAGVVSETENAEVQIVVYPAGAPQIISNRRTISRVIMANVSADPLVIAQSNGLLWKSDVPGMPGYHYFTAPSSSAALTVSAAMRTQPGITSAEPLLARHYVTHFVPNDPLFTNQWHLLNTGQGGAAGGDVRVTNAWETVLGTGINIAIMDEGTEYIQEDLISNLNTNLGFDTLDGDLNANAEAGEFHGTAVAGVAAARGDNALGVSGAAPMATIIPIRLLAAGGANLSEQQIADGLLHSNFLMHVHNNSWGPNLAGQNIDVMSDTVSNAFVQATTFGRNGRGTIYVISSGNEGEIGGNANYIGQLNARESIAVGALNDQAERASYSNPGGNLTISAPAGLDSTRFQGTTTTDRMGSDGYNNTVPFPLGDYPNQNYTANFNGTSSAAPLVSGCIALILEANPNLGWRDVQEIIMTTATMNDTNHTGWLTNSAGFTFNNDYGAGMINADAGVQLATNWTNLGTVTNFSLAQTNLLEPIPDFSTNGITRSFEVDLPTDVRLEHVLLKLNATHGARGELEVAVISPHGTRCVVAELNNDVNSDYNYTFLSIQHWGELANGIWQVQLIDQRPGFGGILNALELCWYGTHTNVPTIGLTNPPTIPSGGHPRSRTATRGSTVFFNVDAQGTPPLTYQWITNGVVVPGNNAPIFAVTNVQAGHSGPYAVRIFNTFGNIISRNAELTVNIPPEITLQPNAQNVPVGNPVTFSVAALGNEPLSYQWRLNGVPIPGATSNSLSIANINPSNLGLYDVIVQNPISSIISSPAGLALTAPFSMVSPPSNGTFQFNIFGTDGQRLRIDGSSNLSDWTTLTTNTVSGTTTTFSDSNATNAFRYYRVVPLP